MAKFLKIPSEISKELLLFCDLDEDEQIGEYDFICMVTLFLYSSLEDRLESIFYLLDRDRS